MRFIATLFAVFLLALPAQARDLTPEETRTLKSAINGFTRAMERGNARKIAGTIPPRVLNMIAGTSGMKVKDLEKAMVEQTAAVMKSATFSDLTIDQQNLDATDATMSDGTEIVWTMVPSTFRMTVGEKTTMNEQTMLALRDGRSWYLIRVAEPAQRQMISLVYPFLADIEFPEPVSTPVD